MKFKICFIFFCVLFIIDDISAKRGGSFGRGGSRISHGSSRGTSHGSSHRTSHGSSYGTSSGFSHGTSHRTSSGTTHGQSSNQRIGSYGSSSNKLSTSSTLGHKSSGTETGSITPQQKGNINTNFLNAEGGGATRPAQTKPFQPYLAVPASIPPIGKKPGVVTESKQGSSFQPSAPPQDHIVKSNTGTLQNQGQLPTLHTNPSWSNPYLEANKPTSPAQIHPSWSNPNVATVPHQANPSWNNAYPGVGKPSVLNTQSTAPGSQPPSIGFKDHVYPQTHSTSAGIQFSPPINGHPPYPIHPMPMSSSWSGHSASSLHQTNSMPLGNPYSMHTPGGVYNAPGGVYNAPGGVYNAPGGYHYPQQTQVFAKPASTPYIPGNTILIVPKQEDSQSNRGFGQLVKEALVFSTINAGVNRIINPHTHHYTESKTVDTIPSTATHVTYNNQYFNIPPGVNDPMSSTNTPQINEPSNHETGTSARAINSNNNHPSELTSNVGESFAPSSGNMNPYVQNIPRNRVIGSNSTESKIETSSIQSTENKDRVLPTAGRNGINAQTFTSTPYLILDEELYKISEELFAKNTYNISKYIKLNLQTRVTSSNVTDEAKEPLFYVEPDLWEYPSIYVTRSLYNNYEHDFRKKVNRSLETRKQENLLIDTFLNTNEMTIAMQWLADRGFIDPDDFEKRDVLRRIWFTIFSGSTCGFERVFASENYETAIIGVQDWIYFANQESLNRIDYMGYADKLNLGSTASLLKLNFQIDDIVRPNATIFVGTLPELEMSLYTICFYARPNDLCPISLGGTKLNIYTHSFTYFGNAVIDLGLPIF